MRRIDGMGNIDHQFVAENARTSENLTKEETMILKTTLARFFKGMDKKTLQEQPKAEQFNALNYASVNRLTHISLR